MFIVSIPKVSHKTLCMRYQNIRPIVEMDGKKYFLRDFNESEIFETSYLGNVYKDRRELVDMNQYIPIKGSDFECLHKIGYYGMFKPSISEVLAQISPEYLGIVSAFEIIEWPQTEADVKRHKIIFNNGFHVSKIRLYTKK